MRDSTIQPENITTQQFDGVFVFSLTDVGEIDMHSPIFKEVLLSAADNPDCTSLVVDMSPIEFMDSFALGTLTAALKTCRRAEKNFVVDSPQRSVLKALEITGMSRIMRIITESGEYI